MLLFLVLVSVVGVLGLVALVASMVSESETPAPRALPSATGGALAGSPGTVPTAAPSSVQPVGLSADGLTVAAAVISASSIEVVETVSWPNGGPATIALELPANAAAAGGLAITPDLTVRSLQVSVDGSPVIPTPREGSTDAWVITPPSGAAPRSMQVRYLLDGAIVRSVPSVPGRALAVITPISTGAVGDLPITMAIATTDVLNVYCPTGADQAAISCGHLDGNRWTVTLPPGLPIVVAQLELPGVI